MEVPDRTYMTLVDVGYGKLLEDVELATEVYTTLATDLNLKKAAIMLHAVLSTMTSGSAFRICYEAKRQDGSEALRKLSQEYVPWVYGKRVVLSSAVISPEFAKATGDQDYLDKLSDRAQLVDDFGAVECSSLQASVKTARLMQHAPPELSTHLRVRAGGSGDDYPNTISSID